MTTNRHLGPTEATFGGVGDSKMGLAATEFAAAEVAKLQDGLRQLATEDSLTALTRVAEAIVSCLQRDGKVLFCGNGGSAADAQHLAAELVGRQNYDRGPAAGVALSVDTSVLTAIGNDYGYDEVFSRQVLALGRPGDICVGISTSGRSKNVVKALATARDCRVATVALTGNDPAKWPMPTTSWPCRLRRRPKSRSSNWLPVI